MQSSYQPVTLRDVRESDLDVLRAHRNDPATRMWLEDSGEITSEQQATWFKRGGAAAVRIAAVGGEDVGLSRITRDAASDATLVGLDLFRAHRRKGLAKPVFLATCEAALATGAAKLALWVFLENEPAMRVYAAQNFTIDESEPVKWFVRQFPAQAAATPHAYIRMVR
jgi:RimJ/RimL family protein N-acetyltransferase